MSNDASGLKRLVGELIRFGMVGIASTLVYTVAGILLNRLTTLSPLWSSFCAFCIAFALSFVGQNFFTFRQDRMRLSVMIGFLCVQLFGLTLTQLIVFYATGVRGWMYETAVLIVVFTVPAVTWFLNRTFVFTGARS